MEEEFPTLPPKEKKRSFFSKLVIWFFVICLIAGCALIWFRYYNVYGEGVESGQLKHVVKQGNIFKTYEGVLILTQLSAGSGLPGVEHEFNFSISNDSIANRMMVNSGKYFSVHYREYRRSLPWRGSSRFVVDQIIEMNDSLR